MPSLTTISSSQVWFIESNHCKAVLIVSQTQQQPTPIGRTP
jgi:hypothetical protein